MTTKIRKCLICPNTSQVPDIRLFSFPRINRDIRNIWIFQCKLTDYNVNLRTKYLCSIHFEKQFLGKRILKPRSYPTLHLPISPANRLLRDANFNNQINDPPSNLPQNCNKINTVEEIYVLSSDDDDDGGGGDHNNNVNDDHNNNVDAHNNNNNNNNDYDNSMQQMEVQSYNDQEDINIQIQASEIDESESRFSRSLNRSNKKHSVVIDNIFDEENDGILDDDDDYDDDDDDDDKGDNCDQMNNNNFNATKNYTKSKVPFLGSRSDVHNDDIENEELNESFTKNKKIINLPDQNHQFIKILTKELDNCEQNKLQLANQLSIEMQKNNELIKQNKLSLTELINGIPFLNNQCKHFVNMLVSPRDVLMNTSDEMATTINATTPEFYKYLRNIIGFDNLPNFVSSSSSSSLRGSGSGSTFK